MYIELFPSPASEKERAYPCPFKSTPHTLTNAFPSAPNRRRKSTARNMDADAVQRLADPQLALLGGRAYRTNLPPGATITNLVRGHGEPRAAAAAKGEIAAAAAAAATEASAASAAGPVLRALETPETLPEGVTTDTAGNFVLRLPVQPRFFGAIIGRNGATLRSLQERTGAAVVVPGKSSKDAFVTLQAGTLEKLDAARLEVELVVADAIERSPPTHFVSLPLATSPKVAASVKAFLDDICAGTPVRFQGV